MTDEWIRDVADAKGALYARTHTEGEGTWLKGDVIVENQMSFSDGFVEGWAMASELLRRIICDYHGLGSYERTVIYGLFTSQSNLAGMEDAFPKTTELIRQLESYKE